MKILLIHADKTPWATQRRAEALKKHLTEDEVDILHAKNLPDGGKYDVIHFLYSGGITKSKKYILKHKDKIFTSLASERTIKGYWDDRDVLEEIYRGTKCCVAQNETLRDWVQVIGGEAVFIPNGVDTELFKRDFVVGYVGAKDSAAHKGLNIIQSACEELGLNLITCTKPHEEMPDFYRSIDCLVLMSESEGCNNPTLEALAMNKPVLSTRTGIAEKLNGVFLVERSVESLVLGLRMLSGRIQIEEEYTWKSVTNQYRNVWLSCTSRRGE